MSLGYDLLDELARRGRQNGQFLYDQIQELKQVDSHAELNGFLARHEFPPVGDGATVAEIADALVAEWRRRDTKGAAVALLTAPESWILLILLSPALLAGYGIRALYRLLKKSPAGE